MNDPTEAAARALFLAKAPNQDWDKLDGATKEVFRARARTHAAEAAAAAPPPPAPVAEPAPKVTWKQAAEEVAADVDAAEDMPKKKGKSK